MPGQLRAERGAGDWVRSGRTGRLQRRQLEILAAHDVDYVLVGGVALQLHGYSAETVDVDVTIAVEASNETRVAAALKALRAAPHLIGSPAAHTARFRTARGDAHNDGRR